MSTRKQQKQTNLNQIKMFNLKFKSTMTTIKSLHNIILS